MKTICVIGLGYIGLPTAAVFANSGYNVVGVDLKNDIIDNLNEGKILTSEPQLDTLVKDVVERKLLRGTISPCSADIYIICVPTPITKGKNPDLRYIINAVNDIIPYIKKGNTVILESTSPVGTTKEIVKAILEKTGLDIGTDIYLGYSPERVLTGDILNELISNPRVIAGINEESAINIKKIYKKFVKGEISITDVNTLEMVKLVENTYRDVNIAFANELAKICESLDINVWEVIKYANKHPRVEILNPGPGVGGHCLAIDPWFIVQSRPDLSSLIKTSRKINSNMPEYVFNIVEKLLGYKRENIKIAILGITYKANIDDLRESPILNIADILVKNGYKVSIYDPYIKNHKYIKNDLQEVVKESNLLILGVGHSIFEKIDYEKILQCMDGNLLLDLVNFLDGNYLEDIGFDYKVLGANKH